MQKITTFLWFNNQAEEAANFYVSIFENSKINAITHYSEGAPVPAGTVMTVDFQLEGQEFVALNGGPVYTFNPAVSLVVNCQSQEEVDYYWNKLSASPQDEQCGWLKDKYGLSWQIIPVEMLKMLNDNDKAKSQRAMQAMLQMKKLDINKLRLAFEGK